MSTTYTNVFSPNPVLVSFPQLLNLSLTADTQLAWPTAYQNTNNVVAQILYVTPNAGGHTLTLPQVAIPASGSVPAQPYVSSGFSFFVSNPTGFSFTLSTFTSGQTFNVAAGAFILFYLVQNTTSDGVWATGFPTTSAAVTSVGLAINGSANGNLTVSSSSTNPITGAGTFTLALANDLQALIGFGGNTGFSARTAANNWALRTITGTGNQIQVTNGNGVAGNPTLSLPPTITGINNLTAGNLNITGNSISTTNATRITLTPPVGDQNVEVQGNVIIDATFGAQFIGTDTVHYSLFTAGNQIANITYTLPTVGPTAAQVLQYTGVGTQLAWANVTTFGGASTTNAIAKFSNTTGSLGNSGVLIDSANNITGANSIGAGNISIGTLNSNTITSLNTNGNITLAPNGGGVVFTSSHIGITNGQQLQFFPPSSPGTGNYVGFRLGTAPGAVTVFTLPVADALFANAPLTSNATGVLSFNNIAVLTTSVKLDAVANPTVPSMYGVPVQIIQAPGNGYTIVVLSAIFYLHYSTNAFTGGGNVILQYNNNPFGAGTNALTATILPGFVQSTSNIISTLSGAPLSSASCAPGGVSNVGIFLSNLTGPFVVAGAGSSLTVTVQYIIVPTN